MQLRAPRGTNDLLPASAQAFDFLEQAAHRVFSRYGYRLVETPLFESTEVFVRGIGEATDVVGKEMFSVLSPQALARLCDGSAPKADEQLTLRPEGTAGVARAVVEHGLAASGAAPAKLWYRGSMFRHERPQKGRLRQFHQIGAECIGAASPSADAEAIIMLMRFFEEAGLASSLLRLLVNSMGDENCRPAFREEVRAFILEAADGLCDECRRRADTNPLRAFDCKSPTCKEVMAAAPRITERLCDECAGHYEAVKARLDAAGIVYEEQPLLVRGLDYYTRTVFEVQVDVGLGAQNAIGGGGRYDGLIAQFGGKPTPGLGFAVGLERIVLALEASGGIPVSPLAPQLFVAAVDADSRAAAFALACRLRDAGMRVELDHQDRSLKSQFKLADKSAAPWVAVIGPNELTVGSATLRSMSEGAEQQVRLDATEDFARIVNTMKEGL
ncbi:MAG: histidine--tRNA ligase [Coriobacteriales bacterium]|jgi:histidyl-tRNA synthetase|nr:histidine--tRNA ligase [Coriobacteriales bacterium]